jgi:hypothetical protein
VRERARVGGGAVTGQYSMLLFAPALVVSVRPLDVAASARPCADANGGIYYVPGQDFTTVTAVDRRAANTTTRDSEIS